MPIPSPVAHAETSFRLDELDDAARYYAEFGYVVIRNLIDPALIAKMRAGFASEIKPYKSFIYRQATANPEVNVFTEHGYVLNSVLNLQDLHPQRFAVCRTTGLEIFTCKAMLASVRKLLDDQETLVQTMYFEGNPATWAHQDTYYLDSEEIGRMTAAWIALEYINPGAGRFFVYPRSHLIDMKKNGGDFDIAFNHARYKQLVIDVIANNQLECHAPALNAGDVLFWHAKTIHGSLPTTTPEYSRSSLTAHYIPRSKGFLQFQSRLKPLKLRTYNGTTYHSPKDQSRFANRAVLKVETTFPRLFPLVKKVAIKFLTK